MPLPALPFALLAGIGIVYTLAAALLTGRWRPGVTPVVAKAPSVTILKPLYGMEPKLAENLGTFLRQDYAGAVQMVCGVGSGDDPAVAVVEELQDPPRAGEDLVLSIATRSHGSNGKISNLANMQPYATNDLLVLSDSDMAVAPDYLTRIAATIGRPGVGAVTCLYAGRGDAGLWSRIAAAGISYHFLPSVMVGLATGLARPCMGSTIALRRETLEAIGGFARFADILADDHAIGAAVRDLGLTVMVPPMIVTHGCTETGFAAIAQHELRWNATVRTLDQAGFIGSIVTHPLPLAIIAFAAGGGAVSAWLILSALASRLALAIRIDRLVGWRTMPLWLLPVRDTVSFVLFLATFFVRSVDWRGAKLRMEKHGRVSAGSES